LEVFLSREPAERHDCKGLDNPHREKAAALHLLGLALPDQPLHPPELGEIRGHQDQVAAQRLVGNQQIIGADRSPYSIELGAERAGGSGVLVVEREHGDGSGKESCQATSIDLGPRTLAYSVPELEGGDSRDLDPGPLAQGLLEP